MIEYLEGIIVPYVDHVIKEDNLPSNQNSFSLLTSILFMQVQNIQVKYPCCILIFISGNYTGKFQPADVGLQRPVKHQLKQAQFHYLVSKQKKQLEKGIGQIYNLYSCSSQRNSSWLCRDLQYHAFRKWMENGETGMLATTQLIFKLAIWQAWAKCVSGKWSLSVECLTSAESQDALLEYLETDSELAGEIQKRTSVVYGIDDAEGDEEDGLDDPAIPFTSVVHHLLKLDLKFPTDQYTVAEAEKIDGELRINSVEENIWAYDDFGVRFGADATLP